MTEERERLLAWYDRTARDLPWRRTDDPYAIWVAEIMLQQTRVETVIPYYRRFLERFPTPAALASAPQDEVLAHWSGLGYYRRARLLHAGVQEVVAHYGGEVPADREARRALPGVGPYTAGALGSIAFGRAEPIVDGNVARVLARLRGIDTPLGQAATTRRLWAEAEKLADGPRPGALNQALMELGARVCVPSAPRCGECPLAGACVARAQKRQHELPVQRAKRAPRSVQVAAVVATAGRLHDESLRVCLVRGDGSLFGGLWGLPMEKGAVDRPSARRALKHAGVSARLTHEPVGQVEHVLSHRRLHVHVWRATAARLEPSEDRQLLSLDALAEVGVSKLTHKLLHAAGVT